ncbi:hypothetical protein [Mesorhizobium sp. M0859]|uniref:hypothetical protein n=1 Tax=Mesorhizobium sp. M0859 TaxID=2957014 RepID=UPI00333781E6
MTLTVNDAKTIIGMAARGDKLQDVAAWFGENPARIDEALKGEYGTNEAALNDTLPPKGAPGLKGRRLVAFVEKALAALEAGNVKAATEALQAGVKRWYLHE